jgi:AcrR family transcriptional regulator
MPTRSKSSASRPENPRKNQRQTRARQTRKDILSGATRVLRERGARGLTTNHVAAATGVSIGSLYQYYPNKAALLADLHAEDMGRLWQEILGILRDNTTPARVRFSAMLEASFVAQAQATEHHAALAEVDVDVTETPEFAAIIALAQAELVHFVTEQGPPSSDSASRVEMAVTTVLALLGSLSQTPRDPEDARRLGAETALMLSDYLRLPR